MVLLGRSWSKICLATLALRPVGGVMELSPLDRTKRCTLRKKSAGCAFFSARLDERRDLLGQLGWLVERHEGLRFRDSRDAGVRHRGRQPLRVGDWEEAVSGGPGEEQGKIRA